MKQRVSQVGGQDTHSWILTPLIMCSQTEFRDCQFIGWLLVLSANRMVVNLCCVIPSRLFHSTNGHLVVVLNHILSFDVNGEASLDWLRGCQGTINTVIFFDHRFV